MIPRPFLLLLALALLTGRASAADAVKAPAAPASPAVTPPAPTKAAPAPGGRAAAPAAAMPRNDSSIAPSAPFETFRIVTDRNIFNPNRTGRRDRSEEAPPPRPDIIALVGTMDSDKGLRAFFEGSDPAYRKALQVGESVGPFKVTKVAPNVVDLERDGKTFTATVGQQFRKPEGGEWTLIGEDVVRREAQQSAAAANRADPSAPQAIPANADPALRALMERRNKSLKQ